MATKKRKTTTTNIATTRATTKTTKRSARKPRKKLFKFKKGKEMVKGVASIVVNAGIQKAMDSVFEGRIKKDDFKKKNTEGNEYVDIEAYNKAVEKQKTLRGGANIGLWLIGAGNALPKDYVSAEYLEINALEHGVNTFLGKSKKESIKKVASNFQGIEGIEGIEGADEEAIAMIESASMIESALNDDVVIEADEEIAYLEEAEKQDSEDEKVIYNIEGMEGMNQVVPGIEEESY